MWLPPLESLRNGNITNYSIKCIPDNTSLTTVYYHDGPTTTAVIQGFTSGSQYTCFINASTSVGAGPSSEGLTVITGMLYMYMYMVGEVVHPPNYMVTSVKYHVKDQCLIIVHPPSLKHFADPPILLSCSLTIYSPVPGPPENVRVSTLSASDLQVQWTPHPLQRIVSSYTVYITRMNGSEMSEVTTGRVSEYTVTGLNPFELVTIQVTANNDGGDGPRSDGVEGKTDEARKIITV